MASVQEHLDIWHKCYLIEIDITVIIMESKNCSKCLIEKDLYEFNRRKKSKDGRQCYCKECNSENHSKWRNENRGHRNQYANQYCKNRKQVDESFRISENLRCLLSTCLKKKRQTCIIKKNIDCSLQVLYDWIEYQFIDEMNWDNYGKYWQVDHVLPRSHFNHCDENELALCWNWRNLQPITVAENYKKGNKVDYNLYYKQVSLAAEFLEEFDQDEEFNSDEDSELDSDFCDEFAEMELFD